MAFLNEDDIVNKYFYIFSGLIQRQTIFFQV